VAFLVYQFGTLIVEGHLGNAFVPGLIAIAVMAVCIALIGKKMRASFDQQYELHQAAKANA
jgi:ferrous iron transport protein B